MGAPSTAIAISLAASIPLGFPGARLIVAIVVLGFDLDDVLFDGHEVFNQLAGFDGDQVLNRLEIGKHILQKDINPMAQTG